MTHWEDQLAELVEHRGGALVAYATMLCGDPRTAEDLVQDAVVKVFARWRGTPAAPHPAPDPAARASVVVDGAGTRGTRRGDTAPDDLEAYVRRTVLTLYLDSYRRRRRWTDVLRLTARPDRTASHDDHADDRADVTAALARLTPTQRACVVLRYYDDLTVPLVAAQLGLAEGTVKRHLHDAAGTLRGLLGPVPASTAAPAAPAARPATSTTATTPGSAR